MRRWWDRIFVALIFVIAGFSIYAVWPDEPDRYTPDWMNLPSGRGLPGEILGIELPCASADADPDNPARDCKGMILGLDLQGGKRIVLAAEPVADVDLNEALNVAKQIVEDRINPFGVSESQVQRSGKDRLVVELPGVSTETARDITRPAVLMFCEPLQQKPNPTAPQGGVGSPIATSPQAAQVFYRPGTCEPDVDAAGAVALKGPDGNIALNPDGTIQRITPTYDPGEGALSIPSDIIWTPAQGELNGAPITMTGRYLQASSEIIFDSFGQPLLEFHMTSDGEKVMGSLTKRIKGLPLATFLDGEPVLGTDGNIIAPTVEAELTESGVTRGLPLSDAKRLRTFLNHGAFPVPLTIVQEQDLDATLGDQTVRNSVEAGLVAMLIIMAFMTLYYRLPGVLASLALIVYASVVLAIFKIGIPGIGPVTLTLAGIAGFVLSVGMAVDANILIFERMKEELRNGRSLIPSVEAGFDRAWSSIRDSNIATMMTCGILYWMGDQFGSPLIKGFALTLAVGVIVSLFSAITVTRTFLRLATASPLRHWLLLWTDDTPEELSQARRTAAPAPEAADA